MENSEEMTEERRREPMGCLKKLEKLYYDKVAKGQVYYVTFRKLHSESLAFGLTNLLQFTTSYRNEIYRTIVAWPHWAL